MPRTTRPSPEVVKAAKAAIIESVTNGAYQKHAAEAAGISEATMRRWMEGDEKFADRVRFAQGKAVLDAIEVIKKASFTDWKAAAWWLERAHPKWFSDKTELRVVHSGEVSLEQAMFDDPALTVEAEEVAGELEA